jgi:hypothetical protein
VGVASLVDVVLVLCRERAMTDPASHTQNAVMNMADMTLCTSYHHYAVVQNTHNGLCPSLDTPAGGTWWCNSHQREATAIDRQGVRRCDPALGGILLPCHVVYVDAIVEDDGLLPSSAAPAGGTAAPAPCIESRLDHSQGEP